MLRFLVVAVASIAALCVSAVSVWAGEASTTRIEPRPFYGATVTLEAGVRVFRPLPPTRRVIINPNRTPLNLSQTDVDVDVDVNETRNIYYRGGGYDRPYPYVVHGGFGTFGKVGRYRRSFGGNRGVRRGHAGRERVGRGRAGRSRARH